MSTHIAEAASGWRIRTAVLLVLLLAAAGAVFAYTQSASALESDSMAELLTERSIDAVVSSGSNSTNISAALVRNDGSLVDTSVPNSAAFTDESTIEAKRVFLAWAGQQIIPAEVWMSNSATTSIGNPQNVLPQPLAGSSDDTSWSSTNALEGNFEPDVGSGATVSQLISSEGILGNNGSLAVVLLIAAFMVVAATHGLRLWSFGSLLGGFGSSPRGRTELSTTGSTFDHSMDSPTSAHNGSGGEAFSASDISGPIIGV